MSGSARSITMVSNFTAAVAANRFGLGARPGEISRIADDPRGALRAQLQGGAPLIHDGALLDTATMLSRAADLRPERREHRRVGAGTSADSDSPADSTSTNSAVLPEAVQKLSALFRGIYVDEARRPHARGRARRAFLY